MIIKTLKTPQRVENEQGNTYENTLFANTLIDIKNNVKIKAVLYRTYFFKITKNKREQIQPIDIASTTKKLKFGQILYKRKFTKYPQKP